MIIGDSYTWEYQGIKVLIQAVFKRLMTLAKASTALYVTSLNYIFIFNWKLAGRASRARSNGFFENLPLPTTSSLGRVMLTLESRRNSIVKLMDRYPGLSSKAVTVVLSEEGEGILSRIVISRSPASVTGNSTVSLNGTSPNVADIAAYVFLSLPGLTYPRHRS